MRFYHFYWISLKNKYLCPYSMISNGRRKFSPQISSSITFSVKCFYYLFIHLFSKVNKIIYGQNKLSFLFEQAHGLLYSLKLIVTVDVTSKWKLLRTFTTVGWSTASDTEPVSCRTSQFRVLASASYFYQPLPKVYSCLTNVYSWLSNVILMEESFVHLHIHWTARYCCL